MDSREPNPANRAAYDALRADLVATGFDVVSGEPGVWEGPVFDCFRGLAGVKDRMQIQIVDGFPYRPPKIFVSGLTSDHVNASDEVCLWERGAISQEWKLLTGIEQRCSGWVSANRHGFGPEDESLDAHLYFEDHTDQPLAVVDLSSLRITGDDQTDNLYGKPDKHGYAITLSRHQHGANSIEGRFYFHEGPMPVPPRDLAAFRATLTRRQQSNFDRRIGNVRSGSERIVALFWDTRYGGRNALVLRLTPDTEGVKAIALEVAPTDRDYRALRAGPDADALADKSVAVFGLGALGSHAAIGLAQCGVGNLTLVDRDVLRPGNLTRFHGLAVHGAPKVVSVASVIADCAPWIDVRMVREGPWDPVRILDLFAECDAVLELTGHAGFTEMVSILAQETDVPMVSAALYRSGSVSRIQRQGDGDTPISARMDETRYPVIPTGVEPRRLEPGCSDSVNNASPARVLEVAGDVVQVVIDTALERTTGPDEEIEVFSALETPPFDRVGKLEVAS